MAALDPLFVPGGLSPRDARIALGGLLASQGAGLNIRTGVLSGYTVSGTSATGPMQVSVAAGHHVAMRSTSDGPEVGANDGATTVDIPAAPASNARIDLVWVRATDTDRDGSTAAEIGVTASGTVSATPTGPYGDVPAGALVLAEVRVGAGGVRTTDPQVTITMVAKRTVARGAPIPVADQVERNALTGYEGLKVDRLDLDILERHNGTEWRSLTGADSGETSVPAFGVGSGSATLLAATTLTNPFSGPCIVEAELVGEAAVGGNSSARFVLTVVTTGRAGWARNFSASQLNFAPNVKARHKTTSGQAVTVAVSVDNVGAGGTSGAAGDLRVQWSIRPAR